MKGVERKRRSSLTIIALTIMVHLALFTAGSWAQPPGIVSTTPGDGSIFNATNIFKALLIFAPIVML